MENFVGTLFNNGNNNEKLSDNKIINKKYNVIDLFSGAGGFSLGFKSSGYFNILLSVDNNKNLSETYEKNFKNVKHLTRDILSFNEKEIKELIKDKDVDVIIGGPPCQGFSLAGNIGRLEQNDERNRLFLGYLKFVKVVQPKIFIMENVARLITHNKGETFKVMKEYFKKAGYNIEYEILNSKDYGVPQERRRVFIIGKKGNKKFKFPKKEIKIKTVKEAIEDLPALKSGEENSSIPNHNAMKHSNQMLEKMSFVKDGGNREEIPEILRPKSGDVRKYIRYKSDAPSVCVTGDMRKIFHYNQNRALTPRELARLQTFPDDFVFYGTSINIQQQIGNAVPPLLAKKISLKVKEYLDDKISES
jgi:DNA (cytosine-5-)-methyltransferase